MTREEAITTITRLKNMTWLYRSVEKEQTIEAIDMAIEALKANQPHGEWIDEDGNKVPLDKDGYPLGSCWCNQCHEWLVGSDEYYTKGNFCPSCGAKMVEDYNDK